MAKVEIISFSCRRVVPNRLVCSVNFSHNHNKKKSATTHKHTSEEHRSSRADHGRGGQIFPASSSTIARHHWTAPGAAASAPVARQRPGCSRAARSHRAPRVSGRRPVAPAATRAPPAVRSPSRRAAPCGGRRTGDSRAFRSRSKQTE